MVKKESKDKTENTGSSVYQIELFTNRINTINEHLSTMKKDHHSRRGLLNLVSKRKRLLNYLKNSSMKEYTDIVKKLKLRK